jgi:predicted esterase
MRRLLFLAPLAICSLRGDEFPKGRVVERVVCAGNERQSYALYLPPSYSPEHASPILYCLDPGARGRVPVERFAKAAGLAGWIVAGSNNSRNGPMEVSREAVQWLVRDTHERFAIDDSRMYAAGFSGGARVALAWAANGRIAGVVACGAGLPAKMPKEILFRIYGTAGVDDFNFDEVYAMSRDLNRRGVQQRFAEFPGGHDWLPENLTGSAIDFLSGRLAAEPPAPPSADQKKTAERYTHLMEEVQRSDDNNREAIVQKLRRESALGEDSVERRVARRVLFGIFVHNIEGGRELLAGKKYLEAAKALELAVLVRPDNAEAWYSLAASRAGIHDKRRALDALERAVANGFRDRDRVEQDPVFAALRNDARYAAIFAANR